MWKATKQQKQQRFRVRRWLKRDLVAVADVDSQSFVDAWSKKEFDRQFEDHRTFGLVAELGAVVVGYAIFNLPRYASPARIDLERMAVRPEWRSNGIGRLLVRGVINKLHANRQSLYIPVHEENLGAQKFFRALEIVADRVVRGANPDGRDDFLFVYYELEPREAP